MNTNPFFESYSVSKDLLLIVVILTLAWFLMVLSRKLTRTFRDYMNTRADSAEEIRRIETLARVSAMFPQRSSRSSQACWP